MFSEADYGVLRERDLVVRKINAFNLASAVCKAQAGAPAEIGFPLVGPVDLHLQRIVPRLAARHVVQNVADAVTEASACAATAVWREPKVRTIEHEVIVPSR